MFAVRYIRAQKLDEALNFLQAHGSDTKILAGGTDIMIDLRSGALKTRYLLDVSRLPELQTVAMHDAQLWVGAGVTVSELLDSEAVGRFAPALQKAAAGFASQQVRNVATIGGNVAHCSPCGDTVPPLLIHEATAVVAGPGGRRTVSIEQMASGPYQCALAPAEIITHFVLKPKPEKVKFADFQKIGRRKELAIARLSMAAMARRADDSTLAFIRIALGSCTPTPRRFKAIENFLLNKVPDEKLLWTAGRMLAEQMLAAAGRRPSVIYKEPAVQGLFLRLMQPLI